jgi:small subunit ribosomal protein S3
MGHKVHPLGFRLGIIRDWQGKWYADRHFAEFLREDIKLRKAILEKHAEAAISSVDIERQANQVTVTIRTARPGIVIGRGGQRVEETRHFLEQLIDKKVRLNIQEVHQPELDASLVAQSIAEQMERRVAYRRAMKQSLQRTMQAGAKGVRIHCAGRLGGAEIARRLNMHEGQVPLHTIRADIDYGAVEAHTTMGRIGVKVWIYKGDILPQRKVVEVAPSAVSQPVTADTTIEAEMAAKVDEKPVAKVAKKKAAAPKTRKKAVEPVEEAELPVVEAEAKVEEKPAKAAKKKVAAAPKTRKKAAEVEPEAKVEEKPAKAPKKAKAVKAEEAVEAPKKVSKKTVEKKTK